MATKLVFRRYSTAPKTKVCIIGSGPAGFYVAQHLLKSLPDLTIDIFEKLPVPYGLVRYGVAPDHPEVKNVINTFAKTAGNKNLNFYGNVSLGKDVQFKDVKEAYHAVVLSYGCSEEKKLGVVGEENMISARRLVGWYNGLPEDSDLKVDLNSEICTIVGQGNVAIDVARILLTPIDLLKTTDITNYSLEALSKSKVKTVNLVGRRGPLHVAFTIKEFREMTKLPGVSTVFEAADLSGLDEFLSQLERPRKRLTELLIKTAATEQKGEKQFCPLFFRKPHECLKDGVVFLKTAVKDNLKGIVEDSDRLDKLYSNLTISSVGYKGITPDPDIPFDHSKGIIVPQPGIYASGWICTGPVGVILSTMNNAFQQAANIVHDIQSGKLDVHKSKPGFSHIRTILATKSVPIVNFDGWKKIDKIEVENGQKIGKPREKIVDVGKMIDIGGEN